MARTSSFFSFRSKLAAALALAALADWLFYGQWIGATLGGFALAWAVALFVAVPRMRRGGALVAVLLAMGFAGTLVEDPGPLGWVLFWTAISSAALLTRRRFDDALRWAERLLLAIPFGLFRPLSDLWRMVKVKGSGGASIGTIASTLALPVIGGGIFIALFAGANPLIGNLFANIHIDSPTSVALHALLWLAILWAVWPSFRPHPMATRVTFGPLSLGPLLPRVPLASISLSLITFNAIFAVQNALDLVFLWSGAPLPGTITMADYAHRGAYSLIATALLAGLFVLTVLRPGSDTARRPAIRLMVALWVAQNLLLVASSILRTLDYIGSYSLTELRIAALAWMGLVGLGLVFILWRLIFNKPASWLINANALTAGLVLAAASAVDLGAVAAHWNVRHAREVGGPGIELDLCYLRLQQSSALIPLIELEAKVAGQPLLLDRVRSIREDIMSEVELSQSNWHSWTWRNARRFKAAREMLGPKPAYAGEAKWGRACNAMPNPEPERPAPAPAPQSTPTLTPEAR